MGILNFKPTRSEATEELPLVSDLDKLVQKKVPVMLHGKVRYLKPVTTISFFSFADQLDRIGRMQRDNKEKEVTTGDVLQAYYDIFKTVTDDLTLDDVRKMSHVQCAALIALIIDHIQGKTHGEANEKKKITPPLSA